MTVNEPAGNRLIAALSSPAARAAQSVVALLVLLLVGYVVVAQVNLSRCIAKYANDQAQASAARSAAYEQTVAASKVESDANYNIWTTVHENQKLPPEQQKAAGQAAFDTYIGELAKAKKMRETADADRRRHPLPPPPAQRCA